jgi:hypothetical protein
MRFLRPLALLGLLALAPLGLSPAVHAQDTPPPATCTGYYVCVVTEAQNGEDGASASGFQAMAIGPQAYAGNQDAFAAGNEARAVGLGTYASGTFANATSNYATAIGYSAIAGNTQFIGKNPDGSFGSGAQVAIGELTSATGNISTAIGGNANASADFSTCIGGYCTSSGYASTAVGSEAAATGVNGTTIGTHATTSGNGTTAIGAGSSANCDGCTAIGATTQNTTDYTTAFGNARLTQLSNGSDPTDAVAVQQLFGFANAFGAGSSFAGGVFVSPSFNLDGNLFSDTNGALQYLDGRINGIVIPPVAPPAPPTPPPVSVSSTDPNAVHYDAGSNDASVTLQGENGTTIHNVAAGIAPTDAANVGQVSAAITTSENYTNSQVTQAIQTANSYTDASSKQTLNWAKAYTDQKIAGLSRQISDVSAMSTAMSQQVATFAGASPENHNRIAGGIGMSGGRAATSIGYQHVSDSGHMSWNVGAAVGQDDKTTVGAGMGFSW